MEKTLYINSIGFMKISENSIIDKEEFDILDTTRIHPENYVLAKKIAKDALDDEKDEINECVLKIMKSPEKLEDLDLDDYADHLA